MTKLSDALNPMESSSSKKKFYISEIIMLKSIIALLVLTFFLLTEMQASNKEVKKLKSDLVSRITEVNNNNLLSVK
jgi:hypothetical protein